MRKMVKITGIALAATLVLPACGGGNEASTEDETGPVTLNFTWWGNDDRAEKYNAAIDLFEKANPSITVNGTFTDFGSYWTARSTEAAGRALPDVLQTDLAYLREYTENGHLQDLSEFEGNQIDTSGFDKNQLTSGSIDDEQVALPLGFNTLALFVNPDLVKKAGAEMLPDDYTWEEFNSWVTEITAAGAKNDDGKTIYGSNDYRGTLWVFQQWLAQKGVQPFTDEGEINFTKEQVKEFLDQAAGVSTAKAFTSLERVTQLKPLDAFSAKEQVASFTWDNFLAGYANDTGSDTLEILPVPDGPNGTKDMFYKPAMLLSVGANTKHPAAAAKLVNFLATDAEVGKIFGTSRGVPADKNQRDAMELEKGSTDETVTQYEADVSADATGPAPVAVLGYGTIEQAWARLGEDLAYGKITTAEFADQWWSEAQLAGQ